MLTLTDTCVCVCVCVSLSIISGEEKGKDGAELILSVYQKLHPPVIEFSPSPIVVVFVGSGWSVFFFFFSFSGGAVLHRLCSTLQMHHKNDSMQFCPIDMCSMWDRFKGQVT